jgi:hypothetical protein
MQPLIKSLITDLHAAYFKPNGFKKERQRFHRVIDTAMQEVEFQSSQWNSSDGPITFYVNVSVGFTDIPMKDGKPAMTGKGRLGGLASGAPAQFDLTLANCDDTRSQLLSLLPQALIELPKHYDMSAIEQRQVGTLRFRFPKRGGPNQALQRTTPVGHAACSPQSPPRRHRARPPLSLSLGSFGDATRLL